MALRHEAPEDVTWFAGVELFSIDSELVPIDDDGVEEVAERFLEQCLNSGYSPEELPRILHPTSYATRL